MRERSRTQSGMRAEYLVQRGARHLRPGRECSLQIRHLQKHAQWHRTGPISQPVRAVLLLLQLREAVVELMPRGSRIRRRHAPLRPSRGGFLLPWRCFETQLTENHAADSTTTSQNVNLAFECQINNAMPTTRRSLNENFKSEFPLQNVIEFEI